MSIKNLSRLVHLCIFSLLFYPFFLHFQFCVCELSISFFQSYIFILTLQNFICKLSFLLLNSTVPILTVFVLCASNCGFQFLWWLFSLTYLITRGSYESQDWFISKTYWDYPRGSVVKTVLLLQWAQVWSLGGKLRSCCCKTKKQKKIKKNFWTK